MTNALPLSVIRTPASGDMTGPTVLLIHGFTSRGRVDWPVQRWAKPLSAHGRESLVVDLPGHGSGPDPGSADEVVTSRILDYLGEVARSARSDEIDIVGYSLGARLGWDLATSSPVPVRRMVLGGLSPFEPFAAVDLAAMNALVTDGTQPTDPLTAGIGGMIAATGKRAPALTLLVEGLAREPFDPAATPPKVPTLLARGSDDPMARGIEDIAKHVPQSRVLTVPGDHIGALASCAFASAAFDFLGAADRADTSARCGCSQVYHGVQTP